MTGNPLASIPNSLFVAHLISKDPFSVAVSLVTGVVFVFLTFQVLGFANKRVVSITKNGRRYALPPFVKASYRDVVKGMTTKNTPSVLLQWAQDSGSIFQLKLVEKTMVVMNGDPNLAKEILNDKESSKILPSVNMIRMFHDGGNDIFTSDGVFWKHSRKGMAPAFSSRHIRRMNDIMLLEAENVICHVIDKCVASQTSFDAGSEMTHLTLSAICNAAFEYNISYEERIAFLREVDFVKPELAKFRIPLRKKFGVFIPSVRRANQGGKNIAALGYKILQAYHELDSPQKGTVIDLIANNKAYSGDKERVNDIVILVIGGYDMTGSTMAWTLLDLAKRASEQERIRSELRSMAVEDRANSSALNYFIKESMRLNPVNPLGNPRLITRNIHVEKNQENGLEKDILIPKGSVVLTALNVLNRNPNTFKDPDVFKPSRWINPPEKGTFIPFGLGRRNCIGQVLAMAELRTVLARFLVDYKFTVHSEGTSAYMIGHIPVDVRLFVSKI